MTVVLKDVEIIWSEVNQVAIDLGIPDAPDEMWHTKRKAALEKKVAAMESE
jgi:hypothetical protein